MLFAFAGFELDTERFELRREGVLVDVQSKVLETLVHLIQHREHVVSREELLEGPWRGTLVGDASLSQAVMLARKALDDDGQQQRFIRTVRGKGFRFVGTVMVRGSGSASVDEREPVPSPDASCPGIVGRVTELGELRRAFDDARAGRGGVRLVAGEPGIGKTRLLEQLDAEVRNEAIVLWGRSREGGGAPPYWPWIQVLRELSEGLGRAAFEALPPEVAADLGPLLQRDLTPARLDATRFQLFDALATLLRRVSEQKPILVVLEDLHAADTASLRMLGFVAAPLRRTRALIAGTYRESEVRRDAERWSLLFEVPLSGPPLQLRGLDREGVSRLTERVGGRPCSAAVVDRVGRVTEGNPLFVEELVRALVSEGRDLSSEEDQLAELKLPDRVAEAIGRRLAYLPARTVELMSLTSVLGREADLELVSAVAGVEPAEALQVLGAALDDGVMVETDTPGRMRFSHALVRDALYDRLPRVRRIELHRAAAMALEVLARGSAEPPFALLAHHYDRAAPLAGAQPAVRYAELAAERAVRLGAYEEAANHLMLASRALSSGDAETRGRVLVALGHAHRLAGRSDHAFEEFLRAADIGRQGKLPALVAAAALGWGDTWRESGVVDERLVSLLSEALAGLDPGPGCLRARVMARLAAALYFRGAGGRSEGEVLSRESLAMARGLGEPMTLAATLMSRHFVRWGSASPVDELALVDEVLAIFGEVPQLVRAAQEIRLWQISDCLELGRIGEVRRTTARYSQIAARSKMPLEQSWAARLAALEALIAGRFDEALARSADSLELGQRAQDPNAEPFDIGYRMEAAFARGGREELLRVRTDVARMADASSLLVWRASEARVALRLGDPGRARRLLEEIVDDRLGEAEGDHTRFCAFISLAEVAFALGDRSRAELLYEELAAEANRFALSGSAAVFHGPVAFFAGLLAETCGRLAAARAHHEQALVMSQAAVARPFVARASAALARLLASTDPSRAARLREEATSLAAELRMRAEFESC